MNKETIVSATLNDLKIKFKIIEYREESGQLELEPITTRYVALGINHIMYPERIEEWK
ncbi:unnamed protein product [marine sediment metagenome]|uniref:Uncharacterized protein n=1 Tax=marine sediment metagenome TaxID=412755 RepID=X1JJI1_9ZZZZ